MDWVHIWDESAQRDRCQHCERKPVTLSRNSILLQRLTAARTLHTSTATHLAGTSLDPQVNRLGLASRGAACAVSRYFVQLASASAVATYTYVLRAASVQASLRGCAPFGDVRMQPNLVGLLRQRRTLNFHTSRSLLLPGRADLRVEQAPLGRVLPRQTRLHCAQPGSDSLTRI